MLRNRTFVTTLIAASLVASSVVANSEAEDTLRIPAPVQSIKIAQIEHRFAVDPTVKEVDPAYVEEKAKEIFADTPVMMSICRCESHFRHYLPDGRLNVNQLKRNGKRVSSAAGACQILYKTHYEDWVADEDTNITTVEGNLRHAREMYLNEGTAPWKPSEHCWSSKIASN